MAADKVKTILLVEFVMVSIFLVEHKTILFSNLCIIGHNDWYFAYIPHFKLLQKVVRQGYLPIWTDLIGSGFPVAAYGFCAILNPLNILVAWLTPNVVIGIKTVFALSTVLSTMSITIAMMMFGIFELSLLLIGAFAFHFTFFFTLGKGHLMHFVYMFSPLLLAFAYKIATENRIRNAFLLGLIGGIALLAFWPQFHIRFYALLFIGTLFLILMFEENKLRKVLYLISAACLMLLIAYPQIKITYDLYKLSDLSERSTIFYLRNSLPFSFWNFFNNYRLYEDSISKSLLGWWHHGALIPSVYLLGIFSWFDKNKKLIYWLWSMVFISLFLSLGMYNPFYVFLAKHDLLFSLRLPARMLYLFIVIFPILAAIGLKNIRDVERRKGLIVLGCYFTIMIIMNFLAALAVLNITDWRRPTVAFIKFFNQNICPHSIVFNLERFIGYLFHTFTFDKNFIEIFLSNFSFSLILITLCIFLFFLKKIKYKVLLIILVFISPLQSIFYEIRSDKANAYILEEYTPNVDLTEFNKIYTFRNWDYRNKYDIGADANILYDIPSANMYQRSIYLKKYKDFLLDAEAEIQLGKYDLIRLAGVDGIISKMPLSKFVNKKEIGNGYYLYKIADTQSLIWAIKDKDFIAITDCRIKQNHFDWTIDFFNPCDNCDIVIGRNDFNGFTLYLDGMVQKYDKFYSFYKILKLDAGQHTIKLKFSLIDFLINF
jgi:hypothetical protein